MLNIKLNSEAAPCQHVIKPWCEMCVCVFLVFCFLLLTLLFIKGFLVAMFESVVCGGLTDWHHTHQWGGFESWCESDFPLCVLVVNSPSEWHNNDNNSNNNNNDKSHGFGNQPPFNWRWLLCVIYLYVFIMLHKCDCVLLSTGTRASQRYFISKAKHRLFKCSSLTVVRSKHWNLIVTNIISLWLSILIILQWLRQQIGESCH